MYERFTDRARKVMRLANQEARRFNLDYMATEHILMGLVKEGSGTATHVLKNLGVDLRKIHLEVEKIVQSGPDMVTMGKLPQTPRAKKVIEYSIEEARNLNHNYVGTEHLLLGLLREQEGVAAQVLMNLGLTLERVRHGILDILSKARGDKRSVKRDAGNVPRRRRALGGDLPAYERCQADSVLHGQNVNIVKGIGLVLLPDGDEFQGLFKTAIEPAMADHDLDAIKAGDLYQQGYHLSEVWACIRSAEVIVAAVSRSSPQVMYALGLCFGLHRCPILLVRDPGELPFNLRSLRYLQYDDNAGGVDVLKKDLSRAIQEFLAAARVGAS